MYKVEREHKRKPYRYARELMRENRMRLSNGMRRITRRTIYFQDVWLPFHDEANDYPFEMFYRHYFPF